jgi:hypothetical protein
MEHNGENEYGALCLKQDIPSEIKAPVNEKVCMFTMRTRTGVSASIQYAETDFRQEDRIRQDLHEDL